MIHEPNILVTTEDSTTPFPRKGWKAMGKPEALCSALARHRSTQWIALHMEPLTAVSYPPAPLNPCHRLLTWERLLPPHRELLHSFFRVIIAPGDGVKLLRREELAVVLKTDCPADYFIAGMVERSTQTLVLYRGNLERLLVPFRWFTPSPTTNPNFDDFEVIDHGQTIRLGEYEAAADAILYEFAPDARKRMKENELNHDGSFGAALRRLRLQKGFTQNGFKDVPAKTIARIERGEVEKPRGKTLDRIASALGVKPEEIASY